MADKILKAFIVVMAVVFFWQAYDVMNMVGMSEQECEARGGHIFEHGNGNSVCRYSRN